MGIVLAVGGAGLYFMRSFKPALARDYDVFFAAIGLLCGGILFFQGWRLDPILQFGQFLLAGSTVFFAYESVRLRGVTTDQARRSSYFDEEPTPARVPGGGVRGGWDDSYDQFEDSPPLRRRFSGRGTADEDSEEESYRPRRSLRAAIPEQAASRTSRNRPEESSWKTDSEKTRRMARFSRSEGDDFGEDFGIRRNSRREQRRGTRPSANQQLDNKRRNFENESNSSERSGFSSSVNRPGIPQGKPIRPEAEDAAYSPVKSRPMRSQGKARRSATQSNTSYSSDERNKKSSNRSTRPRDNSSRFDD